MVEDPSGVRLNRFLAEAGVASRRASDRIIGEGRVTIDGRVAVLGDRVPPGSSVLLDGRPVSPEEEDVILAFNKPVGLTCTSSPDDGDSVIEFIGYPKRIFCIGRLDKDSEGLLLLTNNGELADRVMRSRHGHEKEYVVTVDKPLSDGFAEGMSKGVRLSDGTVTRECEVERTGASEFRIVLRQGLNRQIRRMCDRFGYTVTGLKRVRVVNIALGDMRPGRYRNITRAEREELFRRTGLGGPPGR
ncbi:MAG: pseudouridine synthase [Candidatus Methanoplasma sp.]|jgi:23S rRNA pseudouridine2604 synthase|nr:pseudouridine synthase [Candidatus Methanoplasma sp.]